MKTIPTCELSGAALDWAVAKAAGLTMGQIAIDGVKLGFYKPSRDWAQGGPIIERERISIRPDTGSSLFRAFVIRPPEGLSHRYIGQAPLIAAMRCFVGSRLGNEVEIPDELHQV